MHSMRVSFMTFVHRRVHRRSLRSASPLALAARVVLAVGLLMGAGHRAVAQDPSGSGGVQDNAGIFSKDAVRSADEAIARMKARHGHELLVETFPAIPDNLKNEFNQKGKDVFYRDWTDQLARQAHVRGVIVLIVMNPGHLQIEIGKETQQKLFTQQDRQDMQAPLNEALREKKYDEALSRTVTFVEKRMDANDPNPAPDASHPATITTGGSSNTVHGGPAPANAGHGGTAVVYLDRVAQAVGWQETMNREVEAADKGLKEQRDAYVAQLNQALQERKKAIADAAKLSAEQAEALQKANTPEELEKVQLPAEQRFGLYLALGAVGQARESAENAYRQALDRYRTALGDSYQSAVKPAVKQVATEGGFSLVVGPSDKLIYVDPSADVTDKVAEALKKEMPQHAPPEAPKLDLPPFKLPPMGK